MTKKQQIEITKFRRRMRDRVVRGAKLLDKEQPGWEKKIDLSSFNIESPQWCILGQVFMNGMRDKLSMSIRFEDSGYDKGLKVLGFTMQSSDGNIDVDEEAGARYGFALVDYWDSCTVHESEAWDWLATYWIREIDKRRILDRRERNA